MLLFGKSTFFSFHVPALFQKSMGIYPQKNTDLKTVWRSRKLKRPRLLPTQSGYTTITMGSYLTEFLYGFPNVTSQFFHSRGFLISVI